jgi:DNA-binding HxlR family transcriptional regulator/putative sterol carrier protein
VPLRSYGQFCGIAHALDLVGERWALLVVRELILGPKRFTDLSQGLPGVGANILSARLKELEEAGIVSRRRLPPPAASTVYELTEYGRGLEDILLALGRWGVRSMGPRVPGKTLVAEWLALALVAYFQREAAEGVKGTYELKVGDAIFHARVEDGEVEMQHGPAARPDLALETDEETLLALFAGLVSPGNAITSGAVRMEGDEELLASLLAMFRFPLPEVVAQ